MKLLKRYLPLAALLLAMFFAYFSGGLHYLTFNELSQHHSQIINWVDDHPVQAAIYFILSYIGIVACSIPIAIFMTFLGGILFTQPWATLYVDLGMTLGGCIVFLAARSALGDALRSKVEKFISKNEEGFENNAFAYLLFLRMVPIFPYWMINVAPAFLKVSFASFFWGSFLGYLPVAFIFTEAGDGLNSVLEQTKEFSLSTLLPWHAQIALLGVTVFAFMLVIYQRRKTKLKLKNRLDTK